MTKFDLAVGLIFVLTLFLTSISILESDARQLHYEIVEVIDSEAPYHRQIATRVVFPDGSGSVRFPVITDDLEIEST